MSVLLRLVFTTGVVLACSAAAQPPDVPATSRQPVELTARGEALREFLPRAAESLKVSLSAAGTLQGQRVTLFLRDATADQLRTLLADLLSAEPHAPVTWFRTGKDGFRLAESLARKQLAESLRDADLQLLQAQIQSELVVRQPVIESS